MGREAVKFERLLMPAEGLIRLGAAFAGPGLGALLRAAGAAGRARICVGFRRMRCWSVRRPMSSSFESRPKAESRQTLSTPSLNWRQRR